MMPSDRLTQLQALYDQIALDSRNANTNTVPPELPLGFDIDGNLCFLPASSIALQALLPETLELHEALMEQKEKIERHVPSLRRQVFWQPAGTFHLNVGIIRRLSQKPLLDREREELLSRAGKWLETIPKVRPYKLHFKGILITSDGAIIARGYPEDETSWQLRESLIACGFPDQQRIFHITLGRILTQSSPTEWRRLLALTFEDQDLTLGDWVVRQALLIVEAQGFLHDRRHYEIVNAVNFAT